ncbi:MAG: hypothetical protein K8S22_13595 [Betaproteobacteria bacterium]|nr:hypothetical protein [Betaproteobacteria bacterium]
MIVPFALAQKAHALAARHAVERADDQCFGARARHHAVVEAQRVGDHFSVEIIVERHRPAQQRGVVQTRVCAFVDGDASELLARGAVKLHVFALDDAVQSRRSAGTVGREIIGHRKSVLRDSLLEYRDVLRAATEAQHVVGESLVYRAHCVGDRHQRARARRSRFIRPRNAQPEIFGGGHGSVRAEIGGVHRQAVQFVLADAGAFDGVTRRFAQVAEDGLFRLFVVSGAAVADNADVFR